MKYLRIILLLLFVVMGSQAISAYYFMVDGLAYNVNSDGKSVTLTRQNSTYPTYNNLSGGGGDSF